MRPMTFKALAKAITRAEGGKQNLTIAQVSEVLKITLQELSELPASEAMALIEQHQRKCHSNGPNGAA